MRLAIDAGLASYRRGIGNYVFCLTDQISRLNDGPEFLVYSRARIPSDAAKPPFSATILGPNNYAIREQLSLPLRCLLDQVDLLHCPANTCPLLLRPSIKLVVTIHDLIFMMRESQLSSEFDVYHAAGSLYRRITARHAVKRAAAIITVSQKSASDLQRYLQVPAERIHVIQEAAAPRFTRMDPLLARDTVRAAGINCAFLLALGGADPRKNTRGVIEAFAAARAARAKHLKLAIVGLQRRCFPIFVEHAERCGVRSDVIFLEFVPEQTLVAMYNAAEAFLYLSRYEGFGLPLLEAMSCGSPVIASVAGSIPEVAGDAAILVDPSSSAAAADAIARIVANEGLRAELIRRGNNRVRLFSWERAARETVKVYEECLQG